jgi:hypothetical protein
LERFAYYFPLKKLLAKIIGRLFQTYMEVENKFTHSREIKFSSEFELKYFLEDKVDISSENRAFSLIIEGIDRPGLLYPIGADKDEMLLCVLHIPPKEEEIEMHAVVSCIVRNHGDGQSEQEPDLTLTDGETDFCRYWKEVVVFNKGINPIELRYCYTLNLGGKFSLENLECIASANFLPSLPLNIR